LRDFLSNKNPLSDFLANGVKINLSLAVDYTKSNLEYTNEKSLHHIGA